MNIELIDYDEEEDILFLSRKKGPATSHYEGPVILDFDRDGNEIGIVLLEASRYLGMSREQLRNPKIRDYSYRYDLFHGWDLAFEFEDGTRELKIGPLRTQVS